MLLFHNLDPELGPRWTEVSRERTSTHRDIRGAKEYVFYLNYCGLRDLSFYNHSGVLIVFESLAVHDLDYDFF